MGIGVPLVLSFLERLGGTGVLTLKGFGQLSLKWLQDI